MTEDKPKYHPEHPRPCYECKKREERLRDLEVKLATKQGELEYYVRELTNELRRAEAEVERLKREVNDERKVHRCPNPFYGDEHRDEGEPSNTTEVIE